MSKTVSVVETITPKSSTMQQFRTVMVLCAFVVMSLSNNDTPIVAAQINFTTQDTLSSSPDFIKNIVLNEKKDSVFIFYRVNGSGPVSISLLDVNNVSLENHEEKVASGTYQYAFDLRKYKNKSFVIFFRSRNTYSSRKQVVR